MHGLGLHICWLCIVGRRKLLCHQRIQIVGAIVNYRISEGVIMWHITCIETSYRLRFHFERNVSNFLKHCILPTIWSMIKRSVPLCGSTWQWNFISFVNKWPNMELLLLAVPPTRYYDDVVLYLLRTAAVYDFTATPAVTSGASNCDEVESVF